MLPTRQHDTYRFIRDDIARHGRAPLAEGKRRIAAGIRDGYMEELEQYTPTNDGDIVVALIDGDEAPLKRLQRNRGGTLTRLPANAAMDPMRSRMEFQGRLVGQMRRYR